MRRCRLAPSCGMTPVGFGAAGQVQLLGVIRSGRRSTRSPPLRRVHADTRARTSNPDRVDQDHPAQVEHDVTVALADQLVQVLPQLGSGVGVSRSPRTVTTAWPSEGVVVDCNSGAMAASLLWERHGRGPPRQPLLDPARHDPAMLATWPRPVARWRPGGPLALGDVELGGLAFFQRTVALDGAGVHEHVVAGLGL
jgi:hypothetical protein